eukprot:868270-Prorocentrum_minimum.AAC.1
MAFGGAQGTLAHLAATGPVRRKLYPADDARQVAAETEKQNVRTQSVGFRRGFRSLGTNPSGFGPVGIIGYNTLLVLPLRPLAVGHTRRGWRRSRPRRGSYTLSSQLIGPPS